MDAELSSVDASAAPAMPPTSRDAEAARRGSRSGYRPGYEVVAEQILQLITDLGLAPGDRLLTENELAAQLGASRTVVREAVKILSATGRVSAQKGRGLYVADGENVLGATRFGGFFQPTNLDHIFMLFEFRRVQEAEASRLAATRASPSELRVIETAVQTCRHGYLSRDNSEFEAGDDDFHLGVAAPRTTSSLSRQCGRRADYSASRASSESGASAVTRPKRSRSTRPSTVPSRPGSRMLPSRPPTCIWTTRSRTTAARSSVACSARTCREPGHWRSGSDRARFSR